MTARTRSRPRNWLIAAAVTALLAPLALVFAAASPAAATPGKLHEVYMYKVEKHVDLPAEWPDSYLHTHLYCNPGDIALDGMWRVDNVDQAQPPEFLGDERDVVFYASYPDDEGDNTEWHFRMENFADGDAQIKLFVTCIRGTVEAAHGHTHGINISPVHVDNTWTGVGGFPVGENSLTHNVTCPSGTYAVAPGFNFRNDDRQRIFRSWTTGAVGTEMRGWRWAFIINNPLSDARFYLRCISDRVLTAAPGPHTHRIPMTWRPNGVAGHLQSAGPFNGEVERRINCDDGLNGAHYQNYKAMVGGFWIHDWHYVWYLGMDPRPKQRSYKFFYEGPGSGDVYLGALCIRARTDKQIKP